MGRNIIVSEEDIEGIIENDAFVRFKGERFRVVNANYEDEYGRGVVLQSVGGEKSRDFLLKKVLWERKEEGS